MTKGCVYVGKVLQVIPVPLADRLEAVEVVCGAGGKWRGVVQKSQFKVGDTCQVYLPDSLLPKTQVAKIIKFCLTKLTSRLYSKV